MALMLRFLVLVLSLTKILSVDIIPTDTSGQAITVDAKLSKMEKQMEVLKNVLDSILTKIQDSASKQGTMSVQIQELKSRDENLIRGLIAKQNALTTKQHWTESQLQKDEKMIQELSTQVKALTVKQQVVENQIQNQTGLLKELKEQDITLEAQQILLKEDYKSLKLLVKSNQSAYENRFTQSENNIQLAIKLYNQTQQKCRSCQEEIKNLNASVYVDTTVSLKSQQNIIQKDLRTLDVLFRTYRSACENRFTQFEKQLKDYNNQTKECGCQVELHHLNATFSRLHNEKLALNGNTSTCTSVANQTASCPHLEKFGAVILLAKRGNSYGVWSKDPLSSNHRLYYLDANNGESKTLLVYPSESDFTKGTNGMNFTLPVACDGANGLVYGGKLYCNEANTQDIIAIDLNTINITGRISFRSVAGYSAGYRNRCPYYWNGYSDFDIEADERGLWVIWGKQDDSCKIALSKLNIDGDSLFIQKTWFIPVNKNAVGNSFMVCGVLYVIDSYYADPSFIKYQYDTDTSTLTTYTSSSGTKWRNYHRFTAHAHYDPRDKSVIVWDSRHQSKIPVIFQQDITCATYTS